jgi:hypothetical protein
LAADKGSWLWVEVVGDGVALSILSFSMLLLLKAGGLLIWIDIGGALLNLEWGFKAIELAPERPFFTQKKTKDE